ncbi:hypothetical protein JCM16303_000253 [Sporobolomyces ruberrimus]
MSTTPSQAKYSPLEDNDSSDQPYPAPSYEGASSSSGSTQYFVPSLPPLENTPESHLAFYRTELNNLRTENLRLMDKIEEMKAQEVKRLKDDLDKRGFALGFIAVIGISFAFFIFMVLASRH